MLQEPIKLPVYFNTDETTRLEDLDIDYALDIKQMDIRDCLFYNIDNAVPVYDDFNTSYSLITSGSEKFYIALTLEELRKEIQKQRNGSNIQDY